MESTQANELTFEQMLEKLEKESDLNSLLQALQLLYKLFNNIGQNPNEQKFRHIKVTNKTLQTKMFSIKNIDKLVQLAGFQYNKEEESYVLSDQCLIKLLNSIKPLKFKVDLLDAKHNSPEEYKKMIQLIEYQKEYDLQHQKEMQEQQRLKQLFEFDKKEREGMEIKDSHANQMNFGANQKTFKDIGINLNKKRG